MPTKVPLNKEFYCQLGDLEQGLHDFEDFLFLKESFLMANHREQRRHFWLCSSEGRGLAHVYFTIDGSLAYSPLRASFGGVSGVKSVDETVLKLFLSVVLDQLRFHGVRQIHLRQCPSIYQPGFHKTVRGVLKKLHFEQTIVDVNNHITVSAKPLREKLHSMEKKKLRKSVAADFFCSKMGLEQFTEAYDLLVKNRDHGNYPVTMGHDGLLEMFQRLPEEYVLFGCFQEQRLASVIFGIHVNPSIFYTFYMADDPSARMFSPNVQLTEYVYNYCVERGVKLLDLGISTDKGKVNPGLMDFKHHLGAEDSERVEFIKKLV